MLKPESILDLLSLHKGFIVEKEIDGEKLFRWNYLNINSPQSKLFTSLNDVNRKRILAYGQLVMRHSINHITRIEDIMSLINFSSNEKNDPKRWIMETDRIYGPLLPYITLRDLIYAFKIVDYLQPKEHKNVQPSVGGAYFFGACMYLLTYVESDKLDENLIMYDYQLFGSGPIGIEYTNLNDYLDDIFKLSELPEPQ